MRDIKCTEILNLYFKCFFNMAYAAGSNLRNFRKSPNLATISTLTLFSNVLLGLQLHTDSWTHTTLLPVGTINFGAGNYLKS